MFSWIFNLIFGGSNHIKRYDFRVLDFQNNVKHIKAMSFKEAVYLARKDEIDPYRVTIESYENPIGMGYSDGFNQIAFKSSLKKEIIFAGSESKCRDMIAHTSVTEVVPVAYLWANEETINNEILDVEVVE